MTFTLYDFRDLDLMLAVADAVNDDGFVTTEDLASAVGVENKQSVGTRMAYMRRNGIFSFDEKRRLWSLTKGGERVLAARKQANTQGVTEIPDAALIDAMAHITARYRHGDALNATLLRREFLFGTKPGSAAYNNRRRKK
jgi:flagellar hook protein FlgE